jgi:hypothetical protein
MEREGVIKSQLVHRMATALNKAIIRRFYIRLQPISEAIINTDLMMAQRNDAPVIKARVMTRPPIEPVVTPDVHHGQCFPLCAGPFSSVLSS